MCWASTLRPSSPMGARHWTGLPRSGRARVPEACQYVAQGRRRPFVSRNRSKQSAAIASRGGTVSSVARAQSRVALPPALMASGRPSDAGQPAQRVGVTTPRLTWPLDRLIPSSDAVEQRCRQVAYLAEVVELPTVTSNRHELMIAVVASTDTYDARAGRSAGRDAACTDDISVGSVAVGSVVGVDHKAVCHVGKSRDNIDSLERFANPAGRPVSDTTAHRYLDEHVDNCVLRWSGTST